MKRGRPRFGRRLARKSVGTVRPRRRLVPTRPRQPRHATAPRLAVLAGAASARLRAGAALRVARQWLTPHAEARPARRFARDACSGMRVGCMEGPRAPLAGSGIWPCAASLASDLPATAHLDPVPLHEHTSFQAANKPRVRLCLSRYRRRIAPDAGPRRQRRRVHAPRGDSRRTDAPASTGRHAACLASCWVAHMLPRRRIGGRGWSVRLFGASERPPQPRRLALSRNRGSFRVSPSTPARVVVVVVV